MEPGTRLGGYEILGSLGAGAMGEVYRARDVRLRRDVALKLLPQPFASQPELLQRFEREATSLAQISHPNIVTIHAVEHEGPHRFLVMELVDGETLHGRIPPQGMRLDEFFGLAVPLADALAAIHQCGVTHRDLKPSNVIVRRDGRPTIVDFGLARAPGATGAAETLPELTVPGRVLGTPQYMSPEQAQGLAVDARADIFSLGAILYELLSGERAFAGVTVAAVLASVLRDAPAPLPAIRPHVPDALWRIVRRCLEKDPRGRYQSALDLRNDLDDLRREAAVATARPRVPGAIAVLPLVNLSGQPSEEYFADGMTEALITDLAKAGLKVISRGSIMRLKNTERSLDDIGRALGVPLILEGSVLRDRSRVRISARLVRAETGEYLWAERYDREMSDVLALQDDVAHAVAQAVDSKLRGRPRQEIRKLDPVVYLLNLRARHGLHQRTESGFRSALRSFEEAIAVDPTYAPSYVGAAESLNMLSNYGILPPSQIRDRAEAAVRVALEIDPDSPAAHRALAFFHWQFAFNWDAAIAEYERALELDPNSPETSYWFGAFLAVTGLFDRADDLLWRARELDPLSLVIPSVQGWTRYFARRFEEGLPFFASVLNVDPDFHLALWFRGETLVELGRMDEGIASLERAYEGGGRTARLLGYLGYAYGRAGQEEHARQALAELEARGRAGYVPPYFPALVLAGLDEPDRALDQLEEAFRLADTMLRDLKVDAQWDRIRTLPRFAALMARMAFPAAPQNR